MCRTISSDQHRTLSRLELFQGNSFCPVPDELGPWSPRGQLYVWCHDARNITGHYLQRFRGRSMHLPRPVQYNGSFLKIRNAVRNSNIPARHRQCRACACRPSETTGMGSMVAVHTHIGYAPSYSPSSFSASAPARHIHRLHLRSRLHPTGRHQRCKCRPSGLCYHYVHRPRCHYRHPCCRSRRLIRGVCRVPMAEARAHSAPALPLGAARWPRGLTHHSQVVPGLFRVGRAGCHSRRVPTPLPRLLWSGSFATSRH